MPLILTLAGATGAAASRTFDSGSLSIGRGAGNDWVLPDPDRLISKTHCFIATVDGRYVLTDVSSNGVFLNGANERLPRDGQVDLTDGDEMRLGTFVIRVSESDAISAPGAGRAADPYAAGRGGRRADPLAEPAELAPDPLDDDDPGQDPFGEAAAAARSGGGFAHPIASAPAATPRGSDPFDIADEARPAARIDPDDDLLQGIRPADQWRGPSQADNADAPMHAYAAPKALAPVSLDDLDIDALLGDEPPGQPVSPPAAAAPRSVAPPAEAARVAPLVASATSDPFGDSLDDLLADPAPARPAPAVQAPAPQPQAQVAVNVAVSVATPPARAEPPVAAATPDAARLVAAFLEGAGVPGLALGADPEAAMRAAGAVLGAMVEGLRQVLISRASIKNEFRVEQTMLRSRDNNALKFSVTTEDAVAALLQPGRPGYKPPLDSTREAFDDVRSHEMAVMAGVQTALIGLLKRFEPAALESRLQVGTIGGFLPAARKARTWELFCTTYKDIVREAEGDFLSVFGREFARAYDAQSQKL